MNSNDLSFIFPTEQSERIREEILRELVRSAEDLDQKNAVVADAIAAQQIAAEHYMAVRKLAAEKNEGIDIYGLEFMFPTDVNGKLITDGNSSYAKFRYWGMPTGEAVYDALIGQETPLSLMELAQKLGKGGLSVSTRSINASLLNMRGVVKLKDGYILESNLRRQAVEGDPC